MSRDIQIDLVFIDGEAVGGHTYALEFARGDQAVQRAPRNGQSGGGFIEFDELAHLPSNQLLNQSTSGTRAAMAIR
jgi:hypothetical protein